MRAPHDRGELLPGGLCLSGKGFHYVKKLRLAYIGRGGPSPAAKRESLGAVDTPPQAAERRLYRKKRRQHRRYLLTTSLHHASLLLQSFITFSAYPSSLSPSFMTFKSGLLFPLQIYLLDFPPGSASLAWLLAYRLLLTILSPPLGSRLALSLRQRL